MTRQQVKLKAKDDIRGRVFMCFLPFLIVYGVQLLIDSFSAKQTYALIPMIISLLAYPMTVGISKIYLKIVNSKENDINVTEIFSPYKKLNRLGQIILSYFLSTVYIILGLICFIIPGILLALRFSMLQFVLADYEDITWKDAMDKCKEITDKRKGEIFGYGLSFLGWFILSVLTAGILFIYVLPYFQATMANLYYIYNPKITVQEPSFDATYSNNNI